MTIEKHLFWRFYKVRVLGVPSIAMYVTYWPVAHAMNALALLAIGTGAYLLAR